MPSKAAAIIASLAAVAYFGSAPLAGAADRGFYVGGYYGALERSTSKGRDAGQLSSISLDLYDQLGVPAVRSASSFKVDDRSFGFLAGFRWTPNLALELGFLDLGELKYRADDAVTGVNVLTGEIETRQSDLTFKNEMSAFTLSALGIWPITYEWELFGRAGVALTSTKARIENSEIGRFGDTKDGASLLAGGGMSYTFLDVYTLRAEWQRVFDAGRNSIGSKADVDLASIGFTVSF